MDFYSIIYLQSQGIDLHFKIDKLLNDFYFSLSTYNPNSIISKINQNVDSVYTDDYFEEMFRMAREVSEKTHAAFDITVAPLVNAWGFGLGNHDHSKTPDVSKILPFVGYKKVKLENHRISKDNLHIMLDANAIAQGLSCDIIARLLEKNGCKQYMVEIGGEVMCKGHNPEGKNGRSESINPLMIRPMMMNCKL